MQLRDLYSFRGIKELVDSKKNYGLDPFETLKTPNASPIKGISKTLPPIQLKPCKTKRFKRYLLTSKSSKVISTFGVGELKFRKVFHECNTTRKELKIFKISCKKKKNVIKNLMKRCQNAVKEAGKIRDCNEISPEFGYFKEKIKEKQALKKKKKNLLSL